VFAAVAVPAELLFGFGLFAMLGRRRIAAYAFLRLARRGTLLAMLAAIALVTHIDLAAALAVNLASLGLTLVAVLVVAHRDGLVGGRPSGGLFAEQFRFGLQAAPGVVAERLQFRVDSFFVNLFTGIRATGVYSVTSGLAETLWYVPNAVGQVMFSRAVDPLADAGRTAAVLTRTTLAATVLLAIPAFALGPRFVRLVYGPVFVDAGVGLRLILPGVVAYSVVAILTRYLTGSGRPGLGSFILGVGLVANIAANIALVPQFGINGAAAASSISYSLTAILTVVAFTRVSGLGVRETLLIKRSDIAAVAASGRDFAARLARRGRAP
jgi:O-antigen/teichoic acid export membrane protein